MCFLVFSKMFGMYLVVPMIGENIEMKYLVFERVLCSLRPSLLLILKTLLKIDIL